MYDLKISFTATTVSVIKQVSLILLCHLFIILPSSSQFQIILQIIPFLSSSSRF